MANRSSLMQPMMVAALVLFVYIVFVLDNLLPQLIHLLGLSSSLTIFADETHVHIASWREFITVTVIFHTLCALFVISYVRAMTTPAGCVPRTQYWKTGKLGDSASPSLGVTAEQEKRLKKLMLNVDHNSFTQDEIDFLRMMAVVERKNKLGAYRYCSSCLYFKPDRAHHCSLCGECVLRMDHHCPWIANCVGYFNYKFFLLLLFYGTVTVLFTLGALLPRLALVFRPVLSWQYFVTHDIWVALVCVPAAFMFAALLIFMSFHLFLTVRGFTTIEYREKFNNNDALVRHKYMVCHAKYDKGKYGNFKAIFGPWYMWLLPIKPEPMDGIHGTYASRDTDKVPPVPSPDAAKGIAPPELKDI